MNRNSNKLNKLLVMISVIQCVWLYSIIQWPTGDPRSSKSTKRGKGLTNLSIKMGMRFCLGTPRVKTLNVCVDDELKNIVWTCFIDTYWSFTGSLLARLPMAQNIIQIIACMIICHICHMFFRKYIQSPSYISPWNHQEVHRFGLRSHDHKLRSTAMVHLQFMAHGNMVHHLFIAW